MARGLPSIEAALQFSEQGLQWVISAYALSFGGFLPVLPFLGKPKLSEPLAERTGRVQKIDRPDGSLRLHHVGSDR